MSDKNDWQDGYDWIMENKIIEFFNKYQRYPNSTEELQLEAVITEQDVREALDAGYPDEDEDSGYDY
tara:strand:- start:559 stop:759 length:201 start_codon:yes stop_codon:yes gene_type:complete